MSLRDVARSARRRLLVVGALAAALLLGLAGRERLRAPAAGPAAGLRASRTEAPRTQTSGPPWRYGRAGARFTVVEYADLECPYCRAYFPLLRRWIDEHPDVNWEWRHLPLAMHEPAASAEARLVECVGQERGAAAFWQALAWVYAHTRGDGQGLPGGQRYPGLTTAVQRCAAGDRVGRRIRGQADAAARDGVVGTPTLRLEDRTSGQMLLLSGPVEGDALLSAVDLLVAGAAASAPPNGLPTSRHDVQK